MYIGRYDGGSGSGSELGRIEGKEERASRG